MSECVLFKAFNSQLPRLELNSWTELLWRAVNSGSALDRLNTETSRFALQREFMKNRVPTKLANVQQSSLGFANSALWSRKIAALYLRGAHCAAYRVRTSAPPGRFGNCGRLQVDTRHTKTLGFGFHATCTRIRNDSKILPRRNAGCIRMTASKSALAARIVLSGLIGLTAGFLGSLIGVGGGIIMTPLLTSVAGLSQHEAHGTSLVAVSFSSCVGALAYARGRAVHLTAALIVALGAVLTASAGAAYSSRVKSALLRKYFGVFVLIIGVLNFLRSLGLMYVQNTGTSSSAALSLGDNSGDLPRTMRIALTIGAAGCIAGFFSGLMGVGGGTIVIPFLSYIAGFGQREAQGTALAAMVLPSFSGAVTHSRLGHVKNELLFGLLGGVLFGSWIGSGVALRLPYTRLLQVSAVLFVAMGIRSIVTARRGSPRMSEQAE